MVSISSPIKLIFAATILSVGVLLLAACSSGAGGPNASAGGANQGPGGQPSNVNLLNSAAGIAGNQAGFGAGVQSTSAFQIIGHSSGGQPVGISVTGQGEATAAPDLAILNLGVEAVAGTVAQARSEAASAMDAVIQVLRGQGIAEDDIQTRHFSISPRYSRGEVTKCVDIAGPEPAPVPDATAPAPEVTPTPTPAPAPGATTQSVRPQQECFTEYRQVIIGYQVNNQVTAKVRDLDTISSVIDRSTEAGGDLIRFQGIQFTIEDAKALQDEARANAIADLTEKAEQIADSFPGVELGNLIYFTETGGPIPMVQGLESRVAFDAAQPAAPTPIMAGELDVVVTVQAVFDIIYPGS